MKNRIIVIFISCIFVIIIGSIMHIYGYNDIDNSIKNLNWYKYDTKTGYYEKIYFSKEIKYNASLNISSMSGFENCKAYRYDRKKKTVKLDCNKEIIINKKRNNELILTINKEEKHFFKTLSETLNYEFEKQFKKSIVEYKKNKRQIIDLLKISPESLNTVIESGENATIVFYNDKEENISMVLALDVLEKWYANKQNLYLIDQNSINKDSSTYKNIFKNNINNNYPTVIKTNGKIVDSFQIKCQGIDCSMYYKR